MISDEISGKTELYAVLGNPIKHSLSPFIHNTAFRMRSMDKVYVALEVLPDKLKLAIDMMRAFGIKGFNLTMPLKEDVIRYIDALSPEAEAIGAVNCILNKNGRLTGYNTDSQGFALAVLNKKGSIPKTAFILGAGGVAKAIVAQLVLQGVERIYIANRTLNRAEALADKFKNKKQTTLEVVPWKPEIWGKIMSGCGLIVNATSVGMKNNGNLAPSIPWQSINTEAIVFETIYEPLETEFLKRARELKLMTVEGLDLLLYQAAIAFEIWTGQEMPLPVIKENLTRYLTRQPVGTR